MSSASTYLMKTRCVNKLKPSIYAKIRLQCDSEPISLDYNQKHLKLPIGQFTKKIQEKNPAYAALNINYEHSSFDVNSNRPIDESQTTASDLMETSSDGKLIVSFVKKLTIDQFHQKLDNMEKKMDKLESENKSRDARIQNLEKFALYPILYRELIKQIKLKIFKKLNWKRTYEQNCAKIRENLENDTMKAPELVKITKYSKKELKCLFFDLDLGGLNKRAHPNLKEKYRNQSVFIHKNNLHKVINMYGNAKHLSLNLKMFKDFYSSK